MPVTGYPGKPFTSYAFSETAFSCLPIRHLRSWACLTQLHGRCGVKLPLPTTIQLYSKKTTQPISRHLITLPTKVHLIKAMVFPVVMYGWESWTVKKAQCRRIDAFELWCWRRLLRVPWPARRSNQSILKISPGISLEGLMLKLKLQYFLATSCEELTHRKRPWYWEGLGAGGEGDDRGWGGWIASLTWWTWVWVNSGSWWWTGRPGVLRFMGSKESDTPERLNWTESS